MNRKDRTSAKENGLINYLFHTGVKGWIVTGILIMFVVVPVVSVFSGDLNDSEATSQSQSSSERPSHHQTAKQKTERTPKLTPAFVDSLTKVKAYLVEKSDSSYIKKVNLTSGRLTIETEGYTCAGKFIGAGQLSDMAKILGAASELKQANRGVIIKQTDTYTNQNGQDSETLSFGCYYSRSKLNEINFDRYHTLCFKNPDLILTNATGYAVLGAFTRLNDNSLWQDLPQAAKIDDDGVVYEFMDQMG